ncbi:MAG: trypsin-like peptidase domain-containing protein [Candidatus Obscuribacterales bacterium]|nr:trypsin-like peptidase domain-containing protein [Candidatus Obscuribacterales bacterium]
MNSTEYRPTITPKKDGFSGGSALIGLICGLLVAGSFWAGHEFWPGQPQGGGAPGLGSHNAVPGGIPTTPVISPGTNVVADIAAAAMPSVVNIDTRTSVTVPEVMTPFHFFDMFGSPDSGPRQRRYESHGAGSGFIIRPDGYILTNNHVVQKAEEIKVTLADKREFTGKVVGKDKYSDLALVKIEATGLKPAKLGESKSIRPGDWAIAIGSPLGLSQTVTLGIVSAIGRSIDNLNAVELIQTDAAINPGNSGGPLLNIKGEVIGVNNAVRRDGQNIGFAIPIDIAKTASEQLIKTGKIPHPYVGIAMKDMDEKLAKALGVPPDTKGVIVAQTTRNSPAADSGLRAGDVIQKIDGKTVATSREVQNVVRAHKPGDSLVLLVLRQDQLLPITLKIGNYEDVQSDRESEPQERQLIPIEP